MLLKTFMIRSIWSFRKKKQTTNNQKNNTPPKKNYQKNTLELQKLSLKVTAGNV